MKPNLDYIMARNRLIPLAEKFAEEQAKGLTHFEERRMVWNKAFLGEMDRLWREHERTSLPPEGNVQG